MSTTERNKAVVRRAVDDVLNAGNLDAVDELYAPEFAPAVKAWIGPFLESFSDVEMRAVDMVAEGAKVVVRFACSGTHTGGWRGTAPTGRRFQDVDEVYIFRLDANGRIASAWGVEDTLDRMRQLGLAPALHEDVDL